MTAIDSATPNGWRARKLSPLGAALTFTAPGVFQYQTNGAGISATVPAAGGGIFFRLQKN